MDEIRIHGRGGQGAVTSSYVLAIAAFHNKKYCQAFPNFGVERMGAPVESFVRIDNKPINVRQHVYEPDAVIVLDPSLLEAVDVTSGLKKNGLLIINTDKKASELQIKKRKNLKVHCINITKTALDIIGKPFVNLAALAAYAAISKKVSLQALNKAIDQQLASKGKMAELNKKAAAKVYKEAMGKA